jgi:DNA-directed RNA polymerase specialized sigma24 family protein
MIVDPNIKKVFYVNPKQFRIDMTKYYEDDKMTDELAINLVKIAEGLSYNWRFINYTKSWRDEMVGDAIVKMYAALESKKFRIDSEFSPFAYFNQIAWHAFCNRIKKEKKQHDGLEEYKQMMYEDAMHDPAVQGHVYVKPHLESDENDGDYE